MLSAVLALAACGPAGTGGEPAGGGEAASSPAPAPAPAPATAPAPAAAPQTDATATDRAVERLAQTYDELAALLERNSGDAMGWAQEDIENLGDWEYRIVELDDESPEALEAELNTLGDERWEAYWVESTRRGVRVYLKRSSISYLSRVPLSTLGRLLGGGQ